MNDAHGLSICPLPGLQCLKTLPHHSLTKTPWWVQKLRQEDSKYFFPRITELLSRGVRISLQPWF